MTPTFLTMATALSGLMPYREDTQRKRLHDQIQKTCPTCKTKFPGMDRVFCSPECKENYK